MTLKNLVIPIGGKVLGIVNSTMVVAYDHIENIQFQVKVNKISLSHILPEFYPVDPKLQNTTLELLIWS